MAVAGIVAEYDPFHLGHAWHVAATRRQLGEETAVVCVLSGHWKQRGDCALTDKWTRSALALCGGADLVLELPLWWATASAEGFAQGAVALLKATGVVDTLSFGSESGSLADLRQLAKALEGEPYQAALREELARGVSFAQARQRAALRAAGPQAKHLRGANDNLAVEYLRAAGETLSAVAVPRAGPTHDSPSPTEGFASASLIRAAARSGDWSAVAAWTPPGTVEALQRAGIADLRNAQRAVLARLRTMTESDFAALPDSGAGEGLPARLLRAAREATTLEKFYAQAKTKRYAHARLRRLAVRAFLGLTESARPESPAYLRVLGLNSRGQMLLREMKQRSTLPILTKPTQARALPPQALAQFEAEARGTDLYALCFETVRPAGADWRTSPVVEK